MTNLQKSGGHSAPTASTLSSDINVITAEINAYKQVAGEAIFEIGRRLKHVKENDLAHGEFGKWLESIGMNHRVANQMMKVAMELGGGKWRTSSNLGLEALYQIATLPPDQREQPHTIPSTGETKTVDEMTVRELREVKRKLKEEQEARKRDVARVKMEKERTEQELVRTQQVLREMEDDIRSKRSKIDDIEHEKKLLEKRLKAQEKDVAEVKRIRTEIERLSLERDDIHRQIESATELSRLYVDIENFLQTKLAPVQYSRAITERRDSEVVMDNLQGIISMVEAWCDEMKALLPQKNYINVEVVNYE